MKEKFIEEKCVRIAGIDNEGLRYLKVLLIRLPNLLSINLSFERLINK